MVAVAGGVVFHDARRIELFSLEIGVSDAATGPGAVHRATALVAGGKAHGERTVGLKSPCLVEESPLIDRRMVVVALEHVFKAFPVLFEHLLARIAPRVGDVGLNKKTELIGPIELAGNFNLDVNAVAGKRELFGDKKVVLHELVAGERVPSVRMIALIETELKINRLSVQRNVIVAVGIKTGADFAESEICLNPIGLP